MVTYTPACDSVAKTSNWRGDSTASTTGSRRPFDSRLSRTGEMAIKVWTYSDDNQHAERAQLPAVSSRNCSLLSIINLD
eukprot:scaffold5351_cov199-Alexandrium_tamarense.AAC.16